MEISLVNREVPVYQTASQLRKRTQVNAECVVPDSQEDVGRVAAVCPMLLLKGKDLTPHGVTVSGEVQATVLTVTEDGARLNLLRFSRPFTMDFETAEPDPEALPQISWSLTGAEARVINSRKLSLGFEISAELREFARAPFALESDLPQGEWEKLHLRREEREAMLLSCVTEKTFSVHEQFAFAAGKNLRAEGLGTELRFRVLDTEQVGSRAIVKGELLLTAQGLSEEGTPFRTDFRCPFSQLLEVGEEKLDVWGVCIEPSAAYFDLIDTISGEKALDAEIHGVIQLCAWSRRTVSYLADAYSNLLPCDCDLESRALLTELEWSSSTLSVEERVPIGEDCENLLSVRPSLGQAEYGAETLRAPLSLEILYRSREGKLTPVRRSLELTGQPLPTGAQPLGVTLTDCVLRMEEGSLYVRAAAEIPWRRGTTREIRSLRRLNLQEDAPYDTAVWPGVSLVQAGDEALWDLAKRYHASEERIRELNDPAEKLLLIPCER